MRRVVEGNPCGLASIMEQEAEGTRYNNPPSRLRRATSFQKEAFFCPYMQKLFYLACFIDSEIRFFFSSTSRTITLTTSPTETASEGCLMKRSATWEIWTRPS